jgi:RNA polymerase sigma-70 factor (ECF subfamily)
MEPDPLETLLEKLSSGDNAAAEQVFRAYEPCLRAIVRRMLPSALRPKFDSIDVVQSIWADLLEGFRESGWRFPSVGHLRAFLIKATRNRAIDRMRRHKSAGRQQSLEAAAPLQLLSTEERPSEIAEADELWEKLQELCPPQHRRLLQLRREGHSLQEIARLTELHESSVRRILYDLARRLAST